MTSINRNSLVPYSAEEMYALVDDIPAYADFLPWCKAAEEISRDEDSVTARLDLSYGGLEKSFTTKNRLQHAKIIEMHLVNGPFKHLEGYWRFESLGQQACKVSLDLEFEFSSRLLGMAMGPVFNQVANSLVDAFSQRAEQVYGKR
ncbi:MAG: type II toxin-antitoxin system RatA family toxin [Gammaproteobacteria bacterium]|nr:type II toxin-antitoxin system RatA family toxin [Gammaproteobacteria bacterium]